MLTSLRTWTAIASTLWITVFAQTAAADVFPWQTQPGIGPNEVEVTIDLICSTGGLVCDLLDAYEDTQTATLTGAGDIDVDDVGNFVTFQQDSTQDLGGGPIPAYSTLDASGLTFAEIPLVGTPVTEPGVLFAVTNPSLSIPGLDLNVPGDYPFSGDVDYALIANVIGDLDPYIPSIVTPPDTVSLSGVVRVLSYGDVEIRDTTGTLLYQTPVSLLGEMPTLSVTANLSLNLLVDLPTPVPALSFPGLAVVALLMMGIAGWAQSRIRS